MDGGLIGAEIQRKNNKIAELEQKFVQAKVKIHALQKENEELRNRHYCFEKFGCTRKFFEAGKET